jgi:hypothetical protein
MAIQASAAVEQGISSFAEGGSDMRLVPNTGLAL